MMSWFSQAYRPVFVYGGHHIKSAIVLHTAENCIYSCTLSLVQHKNRLLVIFLLTNRAIFPNDFSQKSQFKTLGRSISVEVRARAIDMLENGATANQAAMRFRATVFRIKSNFRQTGSVKKRPKPCRPRSTAAVQDVF